MKNIKKFKKFFIKKSLQKIVSKTPYPFLLKKVSKKKSLRPHTPFYTPINPCSTTGRAERWKSDSAVTEPEPQPQHQITRTHDPL